MWYLSRRASSKVIHIEQRMRWPSPSPQDTHFARVSASPDSPSYWWFRRSLPLSFHPTIFFFFFYDGPFSFIFLYSISKWRPTDATPWCLISFGPAGRPRVYLYTYPDHRWIYSGKQLKTGSHWDWRGEVNFSESWRQSSLSLWLNWRLFFKFNFILGCCCCCCYFWVVEWNNWISEDRKVFNAIDFYFFPFVCVCVFFSLTLLCVCVGCINKFTGEAPPTPPLVWWMGKEKSERHVKASPPRYQIAVHIITSIELS